MSEVQRTIAQELGRCLLFKGLTEEQLHSIVQKGTVAPYMAGQVLNLDEKAVGFLNVVLKGNLRVHYLESQIFKAGVNHGPGRFYGRLDEALSLGKLSKVEILDTTVIVSFTKQVTLELFGLFPTIKEQLSKVKLAIESRIAQSQPTPPSKLRQERILLPSDANNVATRYDVLTKGLIVRFQNGSLGQLRDVSSTGVFVEGSFSSAANEILQLKMDCPALEIFGFPVKVLVVRVVAEGIGCHLVFDSESEKAQWEDVLLQFKTQQLQTSFEKFLTPLNSGLEASVSKDELSLRGKILKLGLEGIVIQLAQQPHMGVCFISFSVESPGVGKVAFQNDAEFIEHAEGDYLFRFIDLSFDGQKLIQEVLGGKVQAPKDKSAFDDIEMNSAAASISQKREILEVNDQTSLNRLYVRELSYNNIVIYTSTVYKPGDIVDIVVRVGFMPKKRGIKNPNFEFQGKVLRVVEGNTVFELINPSNESIATLGDLVSSGSAQHVSSAIGRVSPAAHRATDSAKSSRILQLLLLLCLLVAVVLFTLTQSEI